MRLQPEIHTAMNDHTPFLPGLSPVKRHEIHARFDGGVLVLREIERGLKIADMLASCLPDTRDPNRTIHDCATMIRERIFAIACGYEDCVDLDELRHAPALKMACERLPESDAPLASQPTLSRLENLPSWRDLARMGLKMIDLFCDSFRKAPEHIVLDIDDTVDRTHGGQQLSLFSTHAGGYCFQPIHIYEARTQKPVCVLLRPGKRPSGEEAARVLRHVIHRIRRNWPRVRIAVRGDGHYGTGQVMDMLENSGCDYIFGLPGNKRLEKIACPWREDVAVRRATSGKDRMRRFFQTSYAARSWSRERRTIARVEATAQGTDVRFIVTNLPGRGKCQVPGDCRHVF
jgi:hypothetical protein